MITQPMNPLTHLGFGLLVATIIGYSGKKRWLIGLLATLPDIDVITSYILGLTDGIVGFDHNTYNTLFYLLEHREFTHSFLFIIIVSGIILAFSRNGRFVFAGGTAMFSHFLLDYFTTWKMRPLYPFVTEGTTMGVFAFFDPFVNIVAITFLVMVLIFSLKEKGKLKGRFGRFHVWFKMNRMKISASLLIAFLAYGILMTGGKMALVSGISSDQGSDIEYQHTYPLTTFRYISGYELNETHYRVLDTYMIIGVVDEVDVKKMTLENVSFENGSLFRNKVLDLYSGSLPGEIDLPAVSIWEEDGIVVELFDARNHLVDTWAYFKPTYRFHFDDDGYRVETRWPGPEWTEIPAERFE